MLNTSNSNFGNFGNLVILDLSSFDKEDDQSIAKFLEFLKELNKSTKNNFDDGNITLNLTKAIHAVNSFNKNGYKQKRDRLLKLLMIIQNLVCLNPSLTTKVVIENGLLSKYAKLLNFFSGSETFCETLIYKIFETLCNIMKNKAIVNDFIENKIMERAHEVCYSIESLLSEDVKIENNKIFNLFFILSTFFTTTLTLERREQLNKLCLPSFILRQLDFLKTKKVEDKERIEQLEIVKFNFVVIFVSLLNEDECEKSKVLNDIVQNIMSIILKIDSDSAKNTEYEKTKFYYQINTTDTSMFITARGVLQRLKTLTKIESIKEKLINTNLREWLKILIEQGNDQEIELSCELMCSLCFNDKVTEYLRNNVNILESIKKRAQETTNALTKRYCNQILYLVSTLNKVELSSYDILISYHHTNVTICNEINDKLKKRSYSTWMDVGLNVPYDQVPYEAVTDAISKASIVVICYCEEYRNTVNCRFEASFAVKHKKRIIFVRVEPDYEPDGWLRSILNKDLKVDYFNNCRDLSSLDKYIKSIRSNESKSTLAENSPVPATLSDSVNKYKKRKLK